MMQSYLTLLLALVASAASGKTGQTLLFAVLFLFLSAEALVCIPQFKFGNLSGTGLILQINA